MLIMRKIVGLLLLLCTFSYSFAQKDYDEVLRKNTYTIRILEEKIRMLESNQRFQMDNLQAQLLLLSAKDTAQQKQMLATLQLYLEQADKKYSQEIAELKKQKDERKNEVNQLIQAHTSNIQEQINQQASMLLFGGLGIIALCIMLFLVATKLMREQQERYLKEFAQKQQADLRTIIHSSFQDNLSREMQKYFQSNPNSNPSPNNEKDEYIALMQQKIFELEEKLKEKEQQTPIPANQTKDEDNNSISDAPTAVYDEKITSQEDTVQQNPSEIEQTEQVLTISEVNTNPNEVKKEQPQEVKIPSPTPEEHISSIEEHNFVSHRDWVEAIEQKINQALKENKDLEEEEVEEQIIYAKEEIQKLPETNSNTYNPEYEGIMAKAMAYYEQKRFDDAIDCYSKAIALNDTDYLAFTKRANCYHILKKYDEAAADYEKAIRIKKDFIPAYNNAIEIYILTDNFFQALTLLERLSQIEKSHSHKAVELYLRLIAQKALMQNTEKVEKELDILLRENFTFNFSVKEIEDWLMTADIDSTDKKMIRVKTELLKMKREYATFA